MGSDLVSLADASQLLGVSSERVRQLVVAGDLAGVRFGNAWAVPRGAVVARHQASNRRGRPLGAKRVWEALSAGDIDLPNVGRYRNRGAVRRYSMSTADTEYLVAERGALRSGVAAAIAYGEPLSAEGAEIHIYVAEGLHARLGSMVAAVEDSLGLVVVRVVADAWWPAALDSADGGRLAPRAAVALDLMDSGDPRQWVAAENLVAFDG